jgi:hypothetical protein
MALVRSRAAAWWSLSLGDPPAAAAADPFLDYAWWPVNAASARTSPSIKEY